jgi:signal transduction histidine kinase
VNPRPGRSGARLRRLASPRTIVLGVTAASTVTTLLVILVPQVHVAFRVPELRIALETAAGLVALLAAFLVFGRFRQNGTLDDLVLACAFAVISFSNLFVGGLPSAFGRGSHEFLAWSAVCGITVGTALFAAAAFARPRRIRRTAPAAALLLVLTTAVIAAIAAVAAALTAEVTLPVGPAPPNAGHAHLAGHPAVLAARITGSLLLAAAAVGFTKRAERTRDEMMTWLAVGAVFAAFWRVNSFLYPLNSFLNPSVYADWVYTADAFRLLFYVVVLLGAAREIWSYWARLAQTAVLDERRRIARDLHDGLAQEIALIGRNAALLAPDDEVADRIRTAADRAFAESRQAIATLAASGDAPLEIALPRAAQEVADALGAKVELAVVRGVRLDHERQEAMLRIAREAIANAVRHGQADEVRVELSPRGSRVCLRVVDRGSGFDLPGTDERAGFGLVSMRERARAVGGDVRISTRPGRGTEVEVLL